MRLAQMWEQEEIQDQDGVEKAQRLSTFVSAESKLVDKVGLDFLVFYQPRWSDFRDWRMYAEIELTVARENLDADLATPVPEMVRLTEIAAENNSTTIFPVPVDLLTPFLKKLKED